MKIDGCGFIDVTYKENCVVLKVHAGDKMRSMGTLMDMVIPNEMVIELAETILKNYEKKKELLK